MAAGGVVSHSSQKRHWSRDNELEACTQLISESTRTQFALLRHWRHSEPVDWAAWNEALDLISLVAASEVVSAASRIDHELWLLSASIIEGNITDVESWNGQRQQLEEARLEFVNTVRSKVVDVRSHLDRSPVARPAHLPDSFTQYRRTSPALGEGADDTALS